MVALAGIGGEERYWVHIPARKPRAYKSGGLVAAAREAKGSPAANMLGDSELIHVNKYELQQLREMWGEPAINPETGLPAFGLFKVFKKIVKGVAKIAATVVLTPVLGPVGAAMAVNAADTAVSGGSFKDIVKSAAFTGVTAGAGQLGAKFAPSIGVSADVGRAVGVGLGATGVGVATGQKLGDAALGGVSAGLGTYTTNKALGSAIRNDTLGIGNAYKGLTNLGYDISNATGIRLGGANYGVNKTGYEAPGDEIIVRAQPNTPLTYTGPTELGPVTSQTPSNQNFDLNNAGSVAQQVTDANGDIIVTARPTTTLSLGPNIPKITGISNAELGLPEDEIVVNALKLPPAVYTPPSDEIIVNANIKPGLTIAQPAAGTPAKEVVKPGDSFGGIVPLYPNPVIAPPPVAPVTPLTPSGGTYSYTPLNRGLSEVTFDPFTYGQATGDQPGEFLFFTQGGKPYGQIASAEMAEGGEVGDDMVSHLIAYKNGGGHNGPGRVKGIGSGQEDKIPAWLSDGEYVWSAQDVADLGDGSTDEGVRRLDKMRQMVRKRAGRKDVKKIAKPQRGIDEMLAAVGGAV